MTLFNCQLDVTWVKSNWSLIVLVLYFCRNFINNLLANCPFLQSNKLAELIQGIFNAAVQTVTKAPPVGKS